ncbi:heavy metal translocating P-type ATPase [Candidatus Halobonum tyrrellensis G22]|uniref:Heavy metal translocating P-type ATPase n=1 Tax=Candidatus Halobonum tyrrellensis G22 TaxID=1324957 RepID=V4HGJ6_9EURY|nr:heavy metal translocating P-type ATPase [Candidatus Halobonum tyrrellensis G22]
MSQHRSRIDIPGMSCANCSQTVSEAAEPLDGVSEANVDLATDEGTVEYDPNVVSPGEIYAAIEAADVTLMRDDPVDVVKAIRISEGTLAKSKQNPFWALGYDTARVARAAPAGTRGEFDGVLQRLGAHEQPAVPAVRARPRLRTARPTPLSLFPS